MRNLLQTKLLLLVSAVWLCSLTVLGCTSKPHNLKTSQPQDLRTSQPQDPKTSQPKTNVMKQKFADKKVLIAFFSRTGENYGVGNIKKGNTYILAEQIADLTGGELFEIVPVKAYPDNYDQCTEVAQKEAEAAARPAIKSSKSIADYDVVFIGYPIWWGDAPMPVYTWIDDQQWQGKTVIPFCTHEGSGLGSTPQLIGNACKGATVLEGFETTGTTAQRHTDKARTAAEKWLGGLDL